MDAANSGYLVEVEEEYSANQALFLNDDGMDGIIALVGGYGSGKSFIGARKALKLALLNRGCRGAIAGPTHGQLMDTAYVSFTELLDQYEIPFEEVRGNRPSIIFPWGDRRRPGPGWVHLRSLDKPSSIKGPTLAWVWIDEAGSIDKGEESFDVVLSRVRDPAAELRQVFLTTTGEAPWLRERFVEEPSENMRHYKASTLENVTLPAIYEKTLRENLPGNLLDVYLEGGFMPPETGTCYSHFSRDIHLRDDLRWNPALPAVHSLDFNVTPHSSVIGQVQNINGVPTALVFDEILIPNGSTPESAAKFLSKLGKHEGGVEVYGDPSGSYRNTASKLTDYAVLRSEYGAAFQGKAAFYYKRHDPGYRARVLSVNALLKNSIGQVRMYIHPRCRNLIYDLEHVTWNLDGSIDKKKVNKKTGWTVSHVSDALAYWIERAFPIIRPLVSTI